MANINLSAAVRSNLSSLQNTASLMSTTSDRLSSGNKVNSALDNPTNYFTASALNSRAGDLNSLMDSMANGIKTIEAADNGIKSITKVVENMQSLVRQARADKTGSATTPGATTITSAAAANSSIGFDLGNGVKVNVATFKAGTNASVTTLTGNNATAIDFSGDETGETLTLEDSAGGGLQTVTFAADSTDLDGLLTEINTQLAGKGFTAEDDGTGKIKFTSAQGGTLTVGGTFADNVGFAAGNTNSSNGKVAVPAAQLTEAELVKSINSNSVLNGKIKASLDATNQLKIENLTSEVITVDGVNAGGTSITGSASDSYALAAASTPSGAPPISDVRQSLKNQFNELRSQLDRLAQDAGFNGINLLNGDQLKLNFNETGTSSITVKGKNSDDSDFGVLTSTKLGVDAQLDADFSADATLDTLSGTLQTALGSLRTQASAYGSNLSVVQNRQDFTKSMINTLETGAGNLTLADMNQEAANMMALQTRQSLASSTLSMANQADQSVLQLLR